MTNSSLPSKARSVCADAELVRSAQLGDSVAFGLLTDRYRAGVFAVVLDFTRHFDAAEDLTQEALSRSWERICELRDPDRFGPWLRVIAVNCFRMWQRNPARRTVPLSSDAPLPPTESSLDAVRRREIECELRRGLAQIPRQNRLALLMHHFGAASYDDIAAFLGVPRSTVEGRIYRAKVQLRRRLARLFEETNDGGEENER